MASCACLTGFRRMAAAALLVLFLPAIGGAQPAVAPAPHIRSIDSRLTELVQEGCRRSFTFRALVEDLERSDVVVYLEPDRFLPPFTSAYLRWVGASAVQRFVRVAVKLPASTETIISLLGHELQHATEVAAAVEVRTAEAFRALYERIGDHTPSGWDTPAARNTGDLVRSELFHAVGTPALSQPLFLPMSHLPAIGPAPSFRR